MNDDSSALQSALNSLSSYQALELPAGTCVTSQTLRVLGKQDVIVFGAGQGQTILRASDPLQSAFTISGSTRVKAFGFAVHSPNATQRTAKAAGRGFYVENSNNVELTDLGVKNVSAAGIVAWQSSGVTISKSSVTNSWADAFHITGASSNVVVQDSTAIGAGDDCFASIGYGDKLNRNITFLRNTCKDNDAAGVSFEGTVGGEARGNTAIRTGGPGIRVASKESWNTGLVKDIKILNNTLEAVRTNSKVDASAIFVVTSLGNISQVQFQGNTVKNGNVIRGRRLLNYTSGASTISDVTFADEKDFSSSGMETTCLDKSSGVSAIDLSNSYLNSNPCEPH